jgi:hypothetical protein
MPPADWPPLGGEAEAGDEEAGGGDGIERLRERIAATREAARRVTEDLEAFGARTMAAGGGSSSSGAAAAPAADAGAGDPGAPSGPPPSGYAVPPSDSSGHSTVAELESLIRSVRELLPEELVRELGALVRELLLLMRALIDWSLERLERRRSAPVEVTDIPIA